MEEQQEEFQIHKAIHPSETRMSGHASVIQACKELENELVEKSLEKAVEDLLSVCHSEYSEGVKGQIFPVQIRKNQEEELEHFLGLLEMRLGEVKSKVFAAKSEGEMDQSIEEEVRVVFLQGTEVRDLVLQMYILLEQHPRIGMVVFIARQITDLGEQNLYCFQKALQGKRFVAVMCTFSTFEGEVQSQAHPHFEKYHISLYNSKQLFCQFVYECVAQPTIKAYLPAGVLTLISDMDYYSISFRESCRRFRYCLQRALMLAHQKFTWVEFDGLITLIEDTISKKFRLYSGYKNSLERILKVILSEKEAYTISQKAVSLEVAMGARFSPIVDENDIMESIRQSLLKHISSRPEFRGYAGYLSEIQDHPQQLLRRKKSRFDQLGIDMKKNVTAKNKLQNQLTKIIKHATQGIRSQAGVINWQDLKFELRIRPQIPRIVIQALQRGEQTKELVDEVLSEYAAPVSKYFSQCSEEQYGKLIYLLKTLQISGLVELSKKQQRPNIYSNFFEKACFGG